MNFAANWLVHLISQEQDDVYLVYQDDHYNIYNVFLSDVEELKNFKAKNSIRRRFLYYTNE